MDARPHPLTLMRSRHHDAKGSSMRRILFVIAVLTGLVLVAASTAAPRSQTLVVRHQLHGCHAWSLNGGGWRVAQAVVVRGLSLPWRHLHRATWSSFTDASPIRRRRRLRSTQHEGRIVRRTFRA